LLIRRFVGSWSGPVGPQLNPPSVLAKIPPPAVEAKTEFPAAARAVTLRFVGPLLAFCQERPLFVERETPPPGVLAKSPAPALSIELTDPDAPGGPN
jgi:hypothetical protein